MPDPSPTAPAEPPEPSSANFAFEQTQMSADRTLMATVRTSLSLISFGFTIYQVLGRASLVLPHASRTARNLGLALLILGLATLTMGLVSHILFSRELAKRRSRPDDYYLTSRAVRHEMFAVYASAGSLLIIGLAALAAILVRLVS